MLPWVLVLQLFCCIVFIFAKQRNTLRNDRVPTGQRTAVAALPSRFRMGQGMEMSQWEIMNIAANYHSPGVSWGAVGTGPTYKTPRALTSERLGPTSPGLCGLHRTNPHPKIRHENKHSEPASALPLSTQTALEKNSSILYQNLASPWHWQGAKRVSWCLTSPRLSLFGFQPIWTLIMNTYHWGFWRGKHVLGHVLQLSLELTGKISADNSEAVKSDSDSFNDSSEVSGFTWIIRSSGLGRRERSNGNYRSKACPQKEILLSGRNGGIYRWVLPCWIHIKVVD